MEICPEQVGAQVGGPGWLLPDAQEQVWLAFVWYAVLVAMNAPHISTQLGAFAELAPFGQVHV